MYVWAVNCWKKSFNRLYMRNSISIAKCREIWAKNHRIHKRVLISETDQQHFDSQKTKHIAKNSIWSRRFFHSTSIHFWCKLVDHFIMTFNLIYIWTTLTLDKNQVVSRAHDDGYFSFCFFCKQLNECVQIFYTKQRMHSFFDDDDDVKIISEIQKSTTYTHSHTHTHTSIILFVQCFSYAKISEQIVLE